MNISSCRFSEWPHGILKLNNLKYLHLDSNCISIIPNKLNSCDILTLSLKNNPLVNIDDSLTELTSVVDVNLDNCLMTMIPAYFKAFERISHLNISKNNIRENGITTLPPNLIKLTLDENLLRTLPDVVQHETKLNSLSVCGCGLTELPSFISNLKRLQRLDVSNNRLTCLPIELKDINVRTLNISSNPVRDLCCLNEMSTLRDLDASRCQLNEFPKRIICLPRLTRLCLGWNGISKLPDSLEHSNLTSLSISDKRLRLLPMSFTDFKSLHTFDMRGSDLQGVPDVLLEMPNITDISLSIYTHFHLRELALPNSWRKMLCVRKLDCSNCSNLISLESLDKVTDLRILSNEESFPIEAVQRKFFKTLNISFHRSGRMKHTIPVLNNLPLLVSLRISADKLAYLPDTIAELTRLEKLFVNRSNLKVFPDKVNASLRKLKVLQLDGNSFSLLPKLWGCKMLKHLNLAGAPIESCVPFTSQLNSLKTLNVSECRLMTFPESLLQLNKLEDLDISNNNISDLPTSWNNIQLLKLNIADNSLVEGWPSIDQLSKLSALDISGNLEIFKIPKCFQQSYWHISCHDENPSQTSNI